jgi:hypothetical protein
MIPVPAAPLRFSGNEIDSRRANMGELSAVQCTVRYACCTLKRETEGYQKNHHEEKQDPGTLVLLPGCGELLEVGPAGRARHCARHCARLLRGRLRFARSLRRGRAPTGLSRRARCAWRACNSSTGSRGSPRPRVDSPALADPAYIGLANLRGPRLRRLGLSSTIRRSRAAPPPAMFGPRCARKQTDARKQDRPLGV